MLDVTKSRRSIRRYTKQEVEESRIMQIIEAGIWAPSGLNNQPWKFAIVRSQEVKEALARQTKYSSIISNAPICIAVFLDKDLSCDRTKDTQAIGACIQNMLLAIHALGLGGVWLGEILKNADNVREILGIPPHMEFMAVVALGYPAEKAVASRRKKPGEVIVLEK